MSELETIPVYRQTAEYAREHNELDAYLTSLQANIACRRIIEGKLRENFDGMIIKRQTAREVIDLCGTARAAYVCASTIRQRDQDPVIKEDNKVWASGLQLPGDMSRLELDSRWGFCLSVHSAVIDYFVRQFRQEVRQKDRPSIVGRLQAVKEEPVMEEKSVHQKKKDKER